LRIPMIAGNWKMNNTVSAAVELIDGLLPRVEPVLADVEVIICPPFTALLAASERLRDTGVCLGAQNMYWKEAGAYTGEISPEMLREVDCRYVICGHSERRGLLGETDEQVARKAVAALEHGLAPIVCVGESLEERQAGEARGVVERQLGAVLAALTPTQAKELAVAYEPIWAIGTGESAQPGDADEAAGWLRGLVASRHGDPCAQRVRILYGGSVKPDNSGSYLQQPNIDGALVGGASLRADAFAAIAASARPEHD